MKPDTSQYPRAMEIINIDLLSQQTHRQETLPSVGQKQYNLMTANEGARRAVQLTPIFYLR